MVIQNHEPLADYFDDLIQTVNNVSFNVDIDGELRMKDCVKPYQHPTDFKYYMRELFWKFKEKYESRRKYPTLEHFMDYRRTRDTLAGR